MKILLFDTTQAYITPGGKAVHAVKLQQELTNLGVHVEFARWWDETQIDYDIIHFFSALNGQLIKGAKKKGKKIILSHIMDYETNKSPFDQKKAMLKIKALKKLPSSIQSKFDWHYFKDFDRILYMHQYDRQTALKYYSDILPGKTMVIPHAYDPKDMGIGDNIILQQKLPSKYLISCGTISARKQSVLLAKLAKKASVPIVFIGNYNENDPYYKEFRSEVDDKFVHFLGYVSKEVKDRVMSSASGFVLLSSGESGCIAVYEAAAYRLPLLLSNLPWAWGYEEPSDIFFCDITDSGKAVEELRKFYNESIQLNHTPFKINTWADIAMRYKDCYLNLLDNG